MLDFSFVRSVIERLGFRWSSGNAYPLRDGRICSEMWFRDPNLDLVEVFVKMEDADLAVVELLNTEDYDLDRALYVAAYGEDEDTAMDRFFETFQLGLSFARRQIAETRKALSQE